MEVVGETYLSCARYRHKINQERDQAIEAVSFAFYKIVGIDSRTHVLYNRPMEFWDRLRAIIRTMRGIGLRHYRPKRHLPRAASFRANPSFRIWGIAQQREAYPTGYTRRAGGGRGYIWDGK